MQGLAGKRAVVTGGGSGIGRAICNRLAREGVVVGVFDIRLPAAQETIEEIVAASGSAFAVECDITDYASVTAAVSRFEAEVGGPADILVNNAGWDMPIPFVESDEAFWKKVVAINYFGLLNVTHALAGGMAARRQGRIINIASDAGRVGSPGEAVYSGCKGATIAFAKSLALELSRHNVLVNTVCPGPTDTPAMAAVMASGEQGQKLRDGLVRRIPLRRIGQPDDYPGVVAFLASDDAAFITGQTISVSGGLTMHG